MTFDPVPILENALTDLNCPGALLALSENGRIQTFSAGSIPAEDHHRPFYIYSISKTFTAVAILQLCESQGDFLDAPFVTFFPETPIPGNITVRQLLNHTGGVSDYFSSPEYQKAVSARPECPWSYEKLMKTGLERTPLFNPGEGWAYSNPGYGLLKELIELKSGMEFGAYIRGNILQKISLKETRVFTEPDVQKLLLEGVDPAMSGDFRVRYYPGWIATGCLISSVSDVARFYDALFGGQLVSNESLTQMMETVDVLKDSPENSIPAYGLGLMHFRKSPLGRGYGHGGGGPGYTTYAVHYPDLNGNALSISLVLNKSLPQTPFDLSGKLVKAYLASKS